MNLGELQKVENKGRKFGASQNYFVVHVKQGKKTYPVMLTEVELRLATERAVINSEDVRPLTGFFNCLKRIFAKI